MPTESTLQPLAYTPLQAAQVVGRTRTRIFDAIKKKEMIALKDGRATLIEANELRRWLSALPTTGRSPAAVA